MDSFWQQLKTPFFALAPMEDVTDTVFREVVLSVSGPSVLRVLFTEFMSTDGFMDERGRERVAERLLVSPGEAQWLSKSGTKLVVQIWGNQPDKFYKTAQHLDQMGRFDGIDINMGCPVKKVVKKNTCSALIRQPALAAEIIAATREGCRLPVSVKTRIGYNHVQTEEWAGFLLQQGLAALTLHGRTQKMMSEGLANWGEIAKAVKIRDAQGLPTCILGNGDVLSYSDGMEKARQYGADGIMVGRGIFSDPWIFNAETERNMDVSDKLRILLLHLNRFSDYWGETKHFLILRRFFKIYISGFPGASKIRAQLMECKGYDEAYSIIRSLQKESGLI
jgi:nifR3 family TIM-barrel protein